MEFLEGVGGDCDVETELVEPFRAFSQLFLENTSIFKFYLSVNVGNTATTDIRLDFCFHFGNFATQIIHDRFAIDGKNMHSNIK